MRVARQASHEHPARVLGVILGDARGDAAGQRPGRHRLRLDRRDRADPAQGRGGQAPRVGGAARCCCPTPPSRSGGRPTRRRTRPTDPLGRARATPDHRRRRAPPAARARRIHRQCASYTPGQHRPGLDPDHAVARAARRRARPAPAQGHGRLGHRRAGQPERRPARRPGCADRLKVDVEPQELERARHHRGRASRPRRDPIRISRPDGRLATYSSPGPSRPADRPQAPRAARAARRGAAPPRRGRRVRRHRPPADEAAGRHERAAGPPGRGPRVRATRSRPRRRRAAAPGSPSRQAAGDEPQIALTGGTIADEIHREIARLVAEQRGRLDPGRLLLGRRALRGARTPTTATPGRPGRRSSTRVGVDPAQVHEMPSTADAADVEAAATAYADTLAVDRQRRSSTW